MKNTPLEDLRLLLQHRLDVIADHAFRDRDPGSHLDALQRVSESIAIWHQQNRKHVDGNLDHFLSGASFSKALEYLDSGVRKPCS